MVNAQKFEKGSVKREEEYNARVLSDCKEVKTYKLSPEQLKQYETLKTDPNEPKPSTLAKVTSMTKGKVTNVMRKAGKPVKEEQPEVAVEESISNQEPVVVVDSHIEVELNQTIDATIGRLNTDAYKLNLMRQGYLDRAEKANKQLQTITNAIFILEEAKMAVTMAGEVRVN
jgi:hypothetical protein